MRRQSEHLADYRAAIDRLSAMGLVYPAFMSRGEVDAATAGAAMAARPGRGTALSAHRSRPRSGGTAGTDRCRRAHALRLDMEKAVDMAGPLVLAGRRLRRAADRCCRIPRAFGDVLLAGRDRPASYHIAVVVDDALQGVTHVVRGRDLYARDRGACAAAAAARPAGAALPPSPADHRCRRSQALQVRPRHGARRRSARPAGRRTTSGGWSGCRGSRIPAPPLHCEEGPAVPGPTPRGGRPPPRPGGRA